MLKGEKFNIAVMNPKALFARDLDCVLKEFPMYGVSEEMLTMAGNAFWRLGYVACADTIRDACESMQNEYKLIDIAAIEQLLTHLFKAIENKDEN